MIEAKKVNHRLDAFNVAKARGYFTYKTGQSYKYRQQWWWHCERENWPPVYVHIIGSGRYAHVSMDLTVNSFRIPLSDVRNPGPVLARQRHASCALSCLGHTYSSAYRAPIEEAHDVARAMLAVALKAKQEARR